MKIGELSKLARVPTRTIRFYESIGVLPRAPRSPNGYREYDSSDLERVRFVRDAQSTGLSLTEITSILQLREAGESTCTHVVDLLAHHLEDLDQHIERLQRTRDSLAKLTDRARALDPADCTDTIRCQTIVAGRGRADLATALHRRPSGHSH
jgi:DNA-binding transcriptional MerR regulator